MDPGVGVGVWEGWPGTSPENTGILNFSKVMRHLRPMGRLMTRLLKSLTLPALGRRGTLLVELSARRGYRFLIMNL